MMDAIIDNSTLSAVERLLGTTIVKNLNNTDHDIVCFEKLITAILFNDNLYLIDDYKPQYSERRKNIFSFITPLNLNDEDYSKASKSAAEFAQELVFGLKGSELIGDVNDFFEQLMLKPQMRWDIFSSSEYLTLTYLVSREDAKESVANRIAAFGNEYSDAQRNENSKAVSVSIADKDTGGSLETIKDYIDRKCLSNPNSSGTGHQSTLESVVFGYGWAGERTKFYEQIAQDRAMNLVLSPLRDAFSIAALGIDNLTNTDRFINNASSDILSSVVEYHSITDGAAQTFAVPFFTAWVMSQNEVRSPRDAISFVLDFKVNRRVLLQRQTRTHFIYIYQFSGSINRGCFPNWKFI